MSIEVTRHVFEYKFWDFFFNILNPATIGVLPSAFTQMQKPSPVLVWQVLDCSKTNLAKYKKYHQIQKKTQKNTKYSKSPQCSCEECLTASGEDSLRYSLARFVQSIFPGKFCFINFLLQSLYHQISHARFVLSFFSGKVCFVNFILQGLFHPSTLLYPVSLIFGCWDTEIQITKIIWLGN